MEKKVLPERDKYQKAVLYLSFLDVGVEKKWKNLKKSVEN